MLIRLRATAVLVSLLAAATLQAAPAAELWAIWQRSDESSTVRIDHADWAGLLERYVSTDGQGINRVAYESVNDVDRALLQTYLQKLTSTDPRDLTCAEQLAYWINLYNALTVEVVLRHPGKASILRMGEGLFRIGPWDDRLVTIAGVEVTLNDIEHRILRPIWQDRRIHYAVNCASFSCPNLALEPYDGARVEAQLAAAEAAYVSDERGVWFDPQRRLYLSKIFDWYQGDFAESEEALLEYLASVNGREAARLRAYDGRVRYRYDWDLNAAGEQTAPAR